MDEKCFGGIYGKEYPCCAGRRTTERKHRSAGGKLCKGDFALVNYIGFNDKGVLLAGGCGDTNGRPCIEKTHHLQWAYEFGKNIYGACDGQ